jgi:hypothetical protein
MGYPKSMPELSRFLGISIAGLGYGKNFRRIF